MGASLREDSAVHTTHQNLPFAVVYSALYGRYQSSFISVEQASEELSIHFTTARSWLTKGCFPLPTQTLGSRRVVPLAGLAEFIVRGAGLGTIKQDDDVEPQVAAIEVAKPPADPNAPKRPRGRPRKNASASVVEVRHG